MLLPEPAVAADDESEAEGSPAFAALVTVFLLVGSWLCMCRRRQLSPKVVDQGTQLKPRVVDQGTQTYDPPVKQARVTQTVEPPDVQAVEPPSMPRECFVAPRYGQKFHRDRSCHGLRSALEVQRLERCKLCG